MQHDGFEHLNIAASSELPQYCFSAVLVDFPSAGSENRDNAVRNKNAEMFSKSEKAYEKSDQLPNRSNSL
jgi:hypothetical protein